MRFKNQSTTDHSSKLTTRSSLLRGVSEAINVWVPRLVDINIMADFVLTIEDNENSLNTNDESDSEDEVG